MPEKTTTNSNSGKKIYVRTYGCAMNVRDSEAIMGLFKTDGFEVVEDFKVADVVFVVTCSVRLGAEDRAVSFMKSLRSLKRKNPDVVLGFLGCAAKNRGEEIKEHLPHVDIIAGPAEVDNILDYVRKLNADPNVDDSILAINDRMRDEAFYSTTHIGNSDHAQVVISMGCNNWCTYCIVPYVRGELRHRKPIDIINEVKKNVAAGRKKITLLGQNVNDYDYFVGASRATPYTFIDLLKEVSAVEGLEELDFMSAHPKNQSKELFKVMAELPNVTNHLHIAIQSGSTKILKDMNRGYSKEQLLDLIDSYKEITNGTLGTDIIVGFPGETDEDFQETVDVVKNVRFKNAYIFMYSPRPHSKAYEMEDDVPLEVKKARHAELLELQRSISKEFKVS